MEVLQLLASPITEICKWAITPLGRQIGYLVHYKRNVEKLKKKVEDLRNTRAELQQKVDAARRNLESIRRVIEVWIERVDMETIGDENMVRLMNGEAIEMINHQCFKGWCSCFTCYSIGRKAQKKMFIVSELLNDGRSFGDVVADPSAPLASIEFVPTIYDFEDFTSRESVMNQVMEALKDEETYLFGVYGMGGVGKTMLMNHVRKRVLEEKLFDAVVITTVSQNVDLKRIQGEIAYKLGFTKLQNVDDIPTRAAMLSARLMQESKILVILDDLWSAMDLSLSDIGIPYRETHPHKCCKVVITTRSLDVCSWMNTQRHIEVRFLSEEDSWHLFKKSVGDVVDSTTLETMAREVARECGGLPIALVTLGKALRNKDKLVWDDTILQLRKSDYTYIDGMDHKVISSIKLSYDYLGNEIIRKCFLLCCLFPEDYRISLDELMMYVMGDDDILEDLETLKQVRGRLHTVFHKLIASSLLLGYKENDAGISYVWMHDIVRDVAISITSKEGKGFFVKAGGGLRNWPDRGIRLLSHNSTSKCLRLSLMENEISVLPEQPELPHLLSLSLEGNISLKELPDKFFESMKALATLDLSRTGISSLPSSLSFLLNLHTLNLDDCNFDQSIDISQIGELKKLEILSLHNCKLQKLPKEFGRLTNLKLLDLSDNVQLDIIPPNMISKLSRLEELNMKNSFTSWEVEGWGNGKEGGFKDEEESDAITLFSKLRVIILRYLSNLETIWKGVIPVLGCLENLKVLNVVGCDKLRYLFSMDMARRCLQQLENSTSASTSTTPPQTIFRVLFPQLSILHLFGLTNLTSFHQTGGSSVYSWPSLQDLIVPRCEKLKRLPLTHQSAPQLRRITGDSDEWFQDLEWESPSVMLHLQPLFQS
ncbi:Disease resistance protein [Macleaya cordata]|uniref:Disease resistance protein n=1 Tax=Macleaya cordata TaxID=56857 RepID=A0A200QRC8_MACCD|nr:Disease resistance protein [Macleaya cordata]